MNLAEFDDSKEHWKLFKMLPGFVTMFQEFCEETAYPKALLLYASKFNNRRNYYNY